MQTPRGYFVVEDVRGCGGRFNGFSEKRKKQKRGWVDSSIKAGERE